MRLTNEDWKYKIINASPTRLVIVTYEIIIDRIDAAEAALRDGKTDEFQSNINNAREFVTEMTASIDISTPVAAELVDLYIFVNKLLTKAYFSKQGKFLNDAKGIIQKLKNGLSKEVDDGGGIIVAEASGNYAPGTTGGGSAGMKYRIY